MKTILKIVTLSTTILFLTACGGDSGDSGVLKDIQDINITNADANASMLATQTKVLQAYVTYNDGTSALTTSNVTWESSEDNVSAGVNETKGQVTLTSNYDGNATISVSFKQFTSSYELVIDGINLIKLTPATIDMSGTTSPFNLDATALFVSGTEENITTTSTWSTSNSSIATVDSSGAVTVLTSGDFNVTVSRLGESNVTVVTNP